MNNYIVRSYRDIIVVTKIATRKADSADITFEDRINEISLL